MSIDSDGDSSLALCRSRGRFAALIATCMCLHLSGCAGFLGGMISSAPNRWIPWSNASARTHPAVRRILGIDQEFRVEVGTAEEPLSLSVEIIEPPEDLSPPKGTVLVLHGVASNAKFMLRHGRMLAHHGYRAVLVDLRGHGKSEGTRLTYGVLESDDLMRVIDELENRNLVAGQLGALGVSYGATTAIHLAGKDPRIKSVVAVAPFSTMRDVVPDFGRTVLPGVGSLVPDETLDAAITRAGAQGHFDPDLSNACEAIQRTEARVLIIHGKEDWMVPTYHGRRLHEAAPENSELVLLPWTGHLVAWLDPTHRVAKHTFDWFDANLAQDRSVATAEE
ncbi:MAG: alpha/beta fold hydrolase [Planctomycetota bacterium]|nr:alpha/beta fold hydrolase [Planctomycetota bacterium]